MDQVEGRKPVMEWLKAHRSVHKLYIQKGTEGAQNTIIPLAKAGGFRYELVEREVLDRMSETKHHQGVIAKVSEISYLTLEELQAIKKPDAYPLYLVLDAIQDPHNFGSLLRTAEAAGVWGVIIPNRRAVGVTSTVMRTSAGAASYMPIARVTNIVSALIELKKQGVWIAGADMEGRLCYQEKLRGALALVIGGEDKGLTPLVKKHCDFLLKLPMQGAMDSLNASVAGGILLYEIVRQRIMEN